MCGLVCLITSQIIGAAQSGGQELPKHPMILTQCAVCATDLGLTLGKKCGRCSTRYCGPECQVQHWKEGGHDQLCKKIKKAGGAFCEDHPASWAARQRRSLPFLCLAEGQER